MGWGGGYPGYGWGGGYPGYGGWGGYPATAAGAVATLLRWLRLSPYSGAYTYPSTTTTSKSAKAAPKADKK